VSLRVGLKLPQQGVSVAELREVWRIADEAGFDHLWNFDHFVPILPEVGAEILEAWTLLAAMAVDTRRVRIGVMVTGNTYRHPGVLAKMATTVDHLSGGRLEFGLGAGWNEREHRMLGIPLETPGVHIAKLAEAIQVIRSLWTRPSATFSGRHYRLQEAISDPKPLQRPCPPVWVGGRGERKTLRVVAELADAWNVINVDPVEAGRLGSVLDAHCAAVGRSPAEIRRSAQLPLDVDDPSRTVSLVHEYAARGFFEPVIGIRPPDPVHAAAVAAEKVLPELRAARFQEVAQ